MRKKVLVMQRTIAVFIVMLSVAGNGCDRKPIPVTWAASGIQVTRLDMPLDGSGHTFMVGEYTLDGREGSGRGAREFRDRVLLTTHASWLEGHVLGYLTRTYAGGHVRTFRLSGTMERVRQNPEVMVMIGRAHELGPNGTVIYASIAWVELKLNPASGRISAKGS